MLDLQFYLAGACLASIVSGDGVDFRWAGALDSLSGTRRAQFYLAEAYFGGASGSGALSSFGVGSDPIECTTVVGPAAIADFLVRRRRMPESNLKNRAIGAGPNHRRALDGIRAHDRSCDKAPL